jgi:hypothetical protein
MSYAQAVMIARARQLGAAQRAATMLHRHLTPRPLALTCWQLGAEPFTVAALAWGFEGQPRRLAVPGEPRNRDLAFRVLLPFADSFNKWFEGGATLQGSPPQIVVANRGNLAMLGRLGRRLAYLQTEGERAAAPALARLGMHLQFVFEHSRRPGQQLVVVLAELLGSNWACEMSGLESQNLAALDAMIEPAPGMSAHEAACVAEQLEIGPSPTASEDEVLERLLAAFNEARNRTTAEAVVAPLRAPIEAHYATLVDRLWPMLWRCLARERRWPEAPSVTRRWAEDLRALDWHLELALRGQRYRTRHTHARAAHMLRGWEDAQRLLVAEEAIDDPLKMLPTLLAGQGFVATLRSRDLDHSERPNKRMVRRPLLEVETDEVCTLPLGTELYWSGAAGSAAFVIHELAASKAGSSSRVVLKHETSAFKDYPQVGETVVFSVHGVKPGNPLRLPERVPWTHATPATTQDDTPDHEEEVA